MIRFIILISIFFFCTSCTDTPYLYNFYIISQPEVDYDLGLYDSVYVNTIQNKYSTKIEVTFNASSKWLGNYWEGNYTLNKDTLKLFVEYNEDKDPNPNMDYSDAYTITYNYCFRNLDTEAYIVIFTTF